MRIYIFKSGTKSGVQAFTGDEDGSQLPEQFRPWHAVGVIAPDRAPPHNLPRDQIEAAIEKEGFQLWRTKPKTTAG